MRSFYIFLFCVAVVAVLQDPGQPIHTAAMSTAAAPLSHYVADELLVKLKPNATIASLASANALAGASLVEEFKDIGWVHIKLPAGMNVKDGMAYYQALSGVESVQPNFIYPILVTPNDAQFASQYGMTKIDAPTAWNSTTGSASVVVAVIDTGVAYAHEDLVANMWHNPGEIAGNGIDDDNNGYVDDYYGYDFINNDADPFDDNSHGSHCAGVIGAAGNNTVGVSGVNWTVRIMALKTHASDGNSTAATVIAAFQYIRMMRNRGINIRVSSSSWGDAPEAGSYDQALKDAIDAAGAADILNVFAAGNNGRNIDPAPFYPASYDSPSIVSVAASDPSDNRASFSNFGVNSVDVAAPGLNILSTVPTTNSYGSKSGTSMACPHVSGAAALLLAANSSLSAASVKATLINSSTPLAQWTGVVRSGGRISVANAIQNQTVCTYGLSTGALQVAAIGGPASVNVTAPNNCGWSAKSNAAWLTVTSGNPGISNGTLNFIVLPNSGAQRVGTITIGNQTLTVTQPGQTLTFASAVFDFDGDTRSDLASIAASGGHLTWNITRSGSGPVAQEFGLAPSAGPIDVAVPGDFDGDGKWDLAVWRATTAPGQQAFFYVLQSQSNTLQSIPWGVTGDVPTVTQDFDGDGRVDPAVVRATGGNLIWYINQSQAGFKAVQFGAATDLPLRGDFDGDRKADIAVYRGSSGAPSNTFFMIRSSTNTFAAIRFGAPGDIFTQGDFDGDLKTDIAVYRPSIGTWFWLRSSDGVFTGQQFGLVSDLPAPGDYDGDGKTDLAVWRPNVLPADPSYFYLNRSTAGFLAVPWSSAPIQIPSATLQAVPLN